MTWVKTIERDSRGRRVNVYTDEEGWKIIQVLRHRGPGGNPRFFYGDEPRVSYRIVSADGRGRADRASSVAGAKRAVATRKAIDVAQADFAEGRPPRHHSDDPALQEKYDGAYQGARDRAWQRRLA